MNHMKSVVASAIFTFCAAWSANGLAADVAGHIAELEGEAKAVLGDVSRELDDGESVYSGETIVTGEDSNIKIIFEDETEFNIGPVGELLIDEFVYNPQSQDGKLAMTVLKGGFRFLSGKAAKKDPTTMRVDLPVATIGIRGTHVVGNVSGETAGVALIENEDGSTGSQITVSNKAGSVTIDEPGYGTDIAGPDVAPSPPRRWDMQRIKTISGMIRRVSVPRPPVFRH